jgi:hypothetical protein
MSDVSLFRQELQDARILLKIKGLLQMSKASDVLGSFLDQIL